jgi:alginate O-acetyltransferase complex protein AlgI
VQLTSLSYLLLLLVSVPLHARLPARARPTLLLLVSLLFYAAPHAAHAVLIVGMALFIYAVGQALQRQPRRWLLAVGLGGCVAVLAYFKYAHWLLLSLADLAAAGGVGPIAAWSTKLAGRLAVDLRVPLGISFFTFEFVHYLTDIYKGRLNAQPVAGSPAQAAASEARGGRDFLLFALFFPTLLAGPIKRYQQFAAQLGAAPTADDVAAGLWRVLLGLGKKILIADTLATVAVRLQQPDQVTPLGLWIGMYAYAGQIYADFSGYSDLAIGTARLYGYRVPENFDWPYLATSLQDFWRRWHISLSSWIRDYLFIPLGGSRVGTARAALNLLAVMALCGLWHGAAWHFVVWGLWHGLGLGLGQLWRRARPLATPTPPGPLGRALQRLVTFHFVCFGWVLFAAPSLHAAGVAFLRMLGRAQ